MKQINKIGFFLFLILFTLSTTCKADILDSLLNILKEQKSDTNKIKTLIDIGWEYSYTNVKQIEPYAKLALSLSEKLNYTEGKAQAYNLIGIANRSISNYSKAIDYFKKALQIRLQLNEVEKQAKVYVNLANVYLDLTNYSQADRYYNIAIEKAKLVNAVNIQLVALTNLSAVHQNLGDYSKSLDCLLQALQINK
ncbi:MAG: tetratricopeptide repeat protein, partial [Bacteroidetes bacterium]|nr:tetratricopeptide repeat protein [Bacteroidota bacterium]